MVKSCHFHLPLVFGDELMIIKMKKKKHADSRRSIWQPNHIHNIAALGPTIVHHRSMLMLMKGAWSNIKYSEQPLCIITQMSVIHYYWVGFNVELRPIVLLGRWGVQNPNAECLNFHWNGLKRIELDQSWPNR